MSNQIKDLYSSNSILKASVNKNKSLSSNKDVSCTFRPLNIQNLKTVTHVESKIEIPESPDKFDRNLKNDKTKFATEFTPKYKCNADINLMYKIKSMKNASKTLDDDHHLARLQKRGLFNNKPESSKKVAHSSVELSVKSQKNISETQATTDHIVLSTYLPNQSTSKSLSSIVLNRKKITLSNDEIKTIHNSNNIKDAKLTINKISSSISNPCADIFKLESNDSKVCIAVQAQQHVECHAVASKISHVGHVVCTNEIDSASASGIQQIPTASGGLSNIYAATTQPAVVSVTRQNPIPNVGALVSYSTATGTETTRPGLQISFHADLGNKWPNENFVRKNLKKRFKGKYRPIAATVAINPKRQQYEKQDRDNHYPSSCSVIGDDPAAVRDRCAPNAQGVGQQVLEEHDGASELDPLQLALDEMNKLQGIGTEDTASLISTQTKPVSSVNQEMKKKRNKANKRYGGFADDYLQNHAPCCGGHAMPGKLCTVKKAGGNKGRKFYGCTFPEDQRCGFFMWVENNPHLITETIKRRQIQHEQDVKLGLTEEQIWKRNALNLYGEKLEDMTVHELRQEIRAYRRRITSDSSVAGVVPVRLALGLGGSRQVLLERLKREAASALQTGGWSDQLQQSSSPSVPAACPAGPKVHMRVEVEDEAVDGHEEEGGGMCLSDSDEEGTSVSSQPSQGAEEEEEDEEEEEESDESSIAGRRQRLVPLGEAKAAAIAEGCPLLRVLRTQFGFSSFRSGQQWAVERSLAGLSSLLVMPTGAGKSLCYMLPSAMLPGLTIVVSPLLSLMQDQLKKLPVELPGLCLSSAVGSSQQQVAEIAAAVTKGLIKVLYVSPEKLCSFSFQNLIRSFKQQRSYVTSLNHNDSSCGDGNQISLLCVDEAHCLSQWSYNFRPSFLRISREISRLQPRAVLALTATATPQVQRDVMAHLRIPTTEGLLALQHSRENLNYSAVSCGQVGCDDEDGQMRKVLLAMLKVTGGCGVGGQKRRREAAQPTIVYVWRRDQAEGLSDYLKASGVPSLCYHAGMDSLQRERAQKQFFGRNAGGASPVMVATVAFGMGIDKADIRRVVHCTLPKSIESYIQETGRAGRDGQEAHCLLLLSGEQAAQQLALSYGGGATRLQVAALLAQVLVPIDETGTQLKSAAGLDLQQLESATDLSAPVAETVLSLLEIEPYHLLQVEGQHMDTVKGHFRTVATAAIRADILVQAILALNKLQHQENVWEGNDASDNSIRPQDEFSSDSGFWSGIPVTVTDSLSKKTTKAPLQSKDTSSLMGKSFAGISILQLSEHTGLSRDEVSKGLWLLQKRGVFQYTLSRPLIYVQVDPLGMQLGKATHEELSVPLFRHWLWRLAGDLTDRLERINSESRGRIEDMWRLGSAVCVCSEATAALPPENNETLQRVIRDTLSGYLRCGSLTAALAERAEDCSLARAVAATTIPVSRIVGDDIDETCYKRLKPLVNVLRFDARLRKIADDIHHNVHSKLMGQHMRRRNIEAGVDCPDEKLLQELVAEKNHLLGHTIARVLYGLQSFLVPAAVWKESDSSLWGSCRNIAYTDIVTVAAQNMILK